MAAVSHSNFVFYPNAAGGDYGSVVAAPKESIAELIERIKISPFPVTAKLGPLVYKNPAFKLKNKVEGRSVYGWERGSERIDTPNKLLLVIGADGRNKQERVYYVQAQSIEHFPLSFRKDPSDQKIYAVSLKRFHESVKCYVNPKPKVLMPQVQLTEAEKEWFDQFMTFPRKSILNDRKQECKDLAQEAFNFFKSIFHGDSARAKVALEHICDANREYTGDLTRAWNGIGDDVVTWQS